MSPRSITSRQPMSRSSSRTLALAPASLPHRNMVCSPGTRLGSTMTEQWTVFRVLTTKSSGWARCRRSPSESSFVTNRLGGAPFANTSGFATSTSTLPRRCARPADSSTSRDTVPGVQLNRSSPNSAASANVPVEARAPAAAAHALAFSLPALREPILTSCPIETSLVPMASPTLPVPKTPTFICSPLGETRARPGSFAARELGRYGIGAERDQRIEGGPGIN